MFPIVRVDSRHRDSLEQLGTKPKFWFRDGKRWMLFKVEERGTGEDWAEKIACELCALLGLPHVHYELAVDVIADVPGVVCETCAPPPTAMGLGNQLLQAIDPEYPDGQKYKVRAHTVDAVADVVGLLQRPPSPYSDAVPPGMGTALSVFIGYIMLDAWIANQDRHHENWAVLRTVDGLHLAPTFDHGASMARNLTDEERQDRMASREERRRIPYFVRRARSAFYADPEQSKPMSTLEAWRAFAQRDSNSATIWLERLAAIDSPMIWNVLDQVPPHRMSQVSRDFTYALLLENQRRLLAGEEDA